MQIAKGVDEVARSKIDNLRHHHRKQRVRCNIERDTEKQICASLIKLTTEFAVLYVKLEEEMTRRQRHFVDFRRIPRAYYQAPALRICFDLRDQIIDLVHSRAVRAAPVAPLRTIDGTAIARFVSPLVPAGYTIFLQIPNNRFVFQQ